jgi:ParB family chromosome partitioning protein
MTQDAGKRLGRGLSALFGEAAPEAQPEQRPTRSLSVDQIAPGPFQPRHRFEDEAMKALADSIRANGILQPILVRPKAGQPGTFEIVAGERRWRAAQLAKLHEVPVVIRELNDRDSLEIALVENLQRQDLTPLEEAEGYRRLLDDFGNTQDDLARRVGKSRTHITNTVRLLMLPAPVRQWVDEGKLTAGHARALLGASDPAAVAAEVVARGLNVRQTERLVTSLTPPTPRQGKKEKDPDTRALERELTTRLGLRVSIDPHGDGGSLTIRYRSLEQLDLVLDRLRTDTVTAAAAVVVQ